MSADVWLDKESPEVYQALVETGRAAGRAALATGIDKRLIELIRIRASQINGCAYCLRIHVADAIALGETTERLAILSAWRDSEYFSPVEQAALAITEDVTLIADVQHRRRLPDDDLSTLTNGQIAAVRWLAIVINAFNRVSITSHYPVHPEQAD